MPLKPILVALCIGIVLTLTSCNVIEDVLRPCTDAEKTRLPDSLEPNDTPATASPLTNSLDAAINPGEVDIYRFETQIGQTLTINGKMLEPGNYPPRYTLKVSGSGGFKQEVTATEHVELTFLVTQPGNYFVTLTEVADVPADCMVCICRDKGSLYHLGLERSS
jgi:hypothetical protein